MKILKRIIVRIMVMLGIVILALTATIGSKSTAQADDTPYECDNQIGQCGTPPPSGGGCGCGC